MSSETPADGAIDHAAAIEYWSSVSADVNGMLGGYPQISRIDLQGSANFLAKLRRRFSSSGPKSGRLARVVDCGAGIGRVTQGFLSKVGDVVDIVEPVEKFVHELQQGDGLRELRDQGRLGEVFVQGLEDWMPAEGAYDLIWNQWCLGHLTDDQLVQYLQRCGRAIKPGGWIVVKENMYGGEGKACFDEVDSSVTRSQETLDELFKKAGLRVLRTELQAGFPPSLGLYPVRFFALRPHPTPNEKEDADSPVCEAE